MPTACQVAPGLTPNQCSGVQGLLLPESLPVAPGNSMADDPNAALLGFQIFYDARFSADEQIRCATCHSPEYHFSDNRARAHGLGEVPRNAPTLLNAAWGHWQFWDGHADTLWTQPLFAFQAPNEMGLTPEAIARIIGTRYRAPYEALFGAWPAQLTASALDEVTTHVGKSLEAYVRRIAAGRSALDAHLLGDTTALSPAAQRGLVVFAQAGCIDCHSGANLSDDAFHNLGVPAWPDADPDPGRATVLRDAAQGRYGLTISSDERASPAAALGAFKTPSLRNLALSAPYGHNGIFAALEDVVDFHLRGGGQDANAYVGDIDAQLVPRSLTSGERGDLLVFLRSLNGAYRGDPMRPPDWWNWPDR